LTPTTISKGNSTSLGLNLKYISGTDKKYSISVYIPENPQVRTYDLSDLSNFFEGYRLNVSYYDMTTDYNVSYSNVSGNMTITTSNPSTSLYVGTFSGIYTSNSTISGIPASLTVTSGTFSMNF
jgi:hypothetical protein